MRVQVTFYEYTVSQLPSGYVFERQTGFLLLVYYFLLV
jgi:hypothetical protein